MKAKAKNETRKSPSYYTILIQFGFRPRKTCLERRVENKGKERRSRKEEEADVQFSHIESEEIEGVYLAFLRPALQLGRWHITQVHGDQSITGLTVYETSETCSLRLLLRTAEPLCPAAGTQSRISPPSAGQKIKIYWQCCESCL